MTQGPAVTQGATVTAGSTAGASPIGARIALIAVIAIIASAHVGTNDVFFAGEAGPWPVRVSIRQPGVIPGLADINVRVEGNGVSRVVVTALRRVADSGEAPPPDVAVPVRGVAGLYSAQLWLMTRGPHEVVVTVEGDRGTGVARIPVMARATRRLAMTRGLRNLLAAGSAFLIIGLLTLIGAAAFEGVLAPGESPGRGDRRRARIAIAAGGATLAGLLFGGWTWIRAEAAQFSRRIDRPWSVAASITSIDREARLDLAITDSLWLMRDDPAWLARNNRYRRADLTADHGKLMHMFLVREPDLDAFAHLHPVTRDANLFTVRLPPLPAGHYRIYADIAAEDGSAQTLVSSVDVPEPPHGSTGNGRQANAEPPGPTPAGTGERGRIADSTKTGPEVTTASTIPAQDPDDAWWTAVDADHDPVTLTWVHGGEPLIAGTDAELRFQLSRADGSPAPLEPYMGMAGHAMLNRLDGQVFVHLHPAGMISMAAQQAIERSDPGPPAAGDAMAGMAHDSSAVGDAMAGMPRESSAAVGSVTFPLVAPPAGRYRVWVQVKVDGRILTRAFDTDVH